MIFNIRNRTYYLLGQYILCNLNIQENIDKLHSHAHVVVILFQVLAVDLDDCPFNPEAEVAFLILAREGQGYLRVPMLVQGADDHLHGVVPAISANPLDYILWKHILLLNQVINKAVEDLENGDIPFNLHLLAFCS